METRAIYRVSTRQKMTSEFYILREKYKNAELCFEGAKLALKEAERQCSHDWSASVEASVYLPSHTIPGDPPGIMGVDWRGSCHVPSRTEKYWKRTCNICGKEEITTNTRQVVTHKPIFP